MLDYILRNRISIDETSKLGFTLYPRRRYSAKIQIDADFTDDLALLHDNSKDIEALLVLLEVVLDAV